jgi:hypothetical protein
VSSLCGWVVANAAALVRGEDGAAFPADVIAHLDGCVACRAITEGAETLRRDLDEWTAPEAPTDLIEQTLARALSAPADTEEQPAEPARSPGRRRTSVVEVLTGGLAEGAAHPRLMRRLLGQAVAAVVLFVACTCFVAVFYPAVTLALEDGRIERCQLRLSRLAAAAAKYHDEHPDGGILQGPDLRHVLIAGGYAQERDFVCPGGSGAELRERSYWGRIPAGSVSITHRRPVFLDRFANHSSGFNVAYANGRTEVITVDGFPSFIARQQE